MMHLQIFLVFIDSCVKLIILFSAEMGILLGCVVPRAANNSAIRGSYNLIQNFRQVQV